MNEKEDSLFKMIDLAQKELKLESQRNKLNIQSKSDLGQNLSSTTHSPLLRNQALKDCFLQRDTSCENDYSDIADELSGNKCNSINSSYTLSTKLFGQNSPADKMKKRNQEIKNKFRQRGDLDQIADKKKNRPNSISINHPKEVQIELFNKQIREPKSNDPEAFTDKVLSIIPLKTGEQVNSVGNNLKGTDNIFKDTENTKRKALGGTTSGGIGEKIEEIVHSGRDTKKRLLKEKKHFHRNKVSLKYRGVEDKKHGVEENKQIHYAQPEIKYCHGNNIENLLSISQSDGNSESNGRISVSGVNGSTSSENIPSVPNPNKQKKENSNKLSNTEKEKEKHKQSYSNIQAISYTKKKSPSPPPLSKISSFCILITFLLRKGFIRSTNHSAV